LGYIDWTQRKTYDGTPPNPQVWYNGGGPITDDVIDDAPQYYTSASGVQTTATASNAYKSIQRFAWAAMQNAQTRPMVLALGPTVLVERNTLPIYIPTGTNTNTIPRDAGFLNIVDAWGKPLEYRDHCNGGANDFPAYNLPFFVSAGRDNRFGVAGFPAEDASSTTYQNAKATFLKDNLYSYEVK
jgi:hypothetical protein